MDWYTWFIIIFINILYDLYKIKHNKNISWYESFDKKRVYGYSDLIMVDLKSLKIIDVMVFFLVLNIHKYILKIQLISFIYFFIRFMFKKDIEMVFNKNIYKRIFIDQPKFVAFILTKKIKNFDKPSIKDLKFILINLNNFILWKNIKFVINNSLITTKFIINLWNDPNFVISIKYIRNRFEYLYINIFDENLKKFENTLLNGNNKI